MINSLEVSALFTGGALIQAFLYLKNKEDLRSFFLCLGFGILCFILQYSTIDPSVRLLVATGAFCIVFAVRCRERILPNLTEHTLLYLNISYAYLLLTHLDWQNPQQLPWLALGLFPSLLTLFLAFYPHPFTRLIHLIAFAWFLIMSLILFVGQFVPLLRSLLTSGSWSSTLHPIEMVTYGSVFFLLLCYGTYIHILIPLPLGRGSFRSKIRDMKEFSWLLHIKYDPKQLRIWESSLILLIQGGLLWGNHSLQLLPASFVINLSILAFGLFGRYSTPTKLRSIHPHE